jgi:pimeloyl-ACP methyl ester carboxylesterase
VSEFHDDELRTFETDGAAPLPAAAAEGYVERDGGRIWYASFGSGRPVLLLHGGFGSGENWGYQVPALVASGHQAILIDSRGHGRSTRTSAPLGYLAMASDAVAVLDQLELDSAAIVGWSDGATVGMILGMNDPGRVDRVFAFAGSMDLGGVKDLPPEHPVVDRMFGRLMADYARLSTTPGDRETFAVAVNEMMSTQPNYSAADLATIAVPVAIVCSDSDEFITREHVEYLGRTIPGATVVILPDVTHFAPLQRPETFNRAMIDYLDGS